MSKIVVFFEHLHCIIKLELYRHKPEFRSQLLIFSVDDSFE